LEGTRKHIIIVLLGIFIFPLLVQPVHMAWHSLLAHADRKHECILHDLLGNFPIETTTFSEVTHFCLICDFHLCIVDEPTTEYINTIIPVSGFSFNETATQYLLTRLIYFSSPRDPPVIIS
jgi:hypothetical protein